MAGRLLELLGSIFSEKMGPKVLQSGNSELLMDKHANKQKKVSLSALILK